jgi:ABC-type sulfate transport system permease component
VIFSIFVVDSPESDVVDVSVPVLVPHVVVALALAIYSGNASSENIQF